MLFRSNGFISLGGTAVFNSTTAETYFDISSASGFNLLVVLAGTTLAFPNASTQRFRISGQCGSPAFYISSPQKISFYNLITDSYANGCGASRFGNNAGTVEIRNDFSHISADGLGINGGFEVYGNISAAAVIDDWATWTAMGAVSKTYTGPGGIGKLIVNKTGGATLTPVDAAQTFAVRALDIQVGSFTFPQTLNMFWSGGVSDIYFKIAAGTTATVPANSTIAIDVRGACGGPTKSIDVNGTFEFQTLTMSGSSTGCGGSTVTLAMGDALTVKKDFTLGSGFGANFDIAVEGHLSVTGPVSGSMALSLIGGVAKNISQASATNPSGTFTINRPAGSATATSNIVLSNAGQNLSVANGTLDLSGRSLIVNNQITVSATGKILCNGGTASAASWVIVGEVSCGTTIGITWTGLAGDNLWSTAANWNR